MELEKLKKMIEKFGTMIGDKYGVEKVEVSFIEKGGGKNHYMLGFKYCMKENRHPLGGHERQSLTKDIVTNFKPLLGIDLTTISTSSTSKEGKKSWY